MGKLKALVETPSTDPDQAVKGARVAGFVFAARLNVAHAQTSRRPALPRMRILCVGQFWGGLRARADLSQVGHNKSLYELQSWRDDGRGRRRLQVLVRCCDGGGASIRF